MQLYLGLDLGQTTDYSALAIVRRETAKDRDPYAYSLSNPYPDEAGDPEARPEYLVGHLHRWPLRTPYPQIAADTARLVLHATAIRPRAERIALVVDATGVGRPVVDL